MGSHFLRQLAELGERFGGSRIDLIGHGAVVLRSSLCVVGGYATYSTAPADGCLLPACPAYSR